MTARSARPAPVPAEWLTAQDVMAELKVSRGYLVDHGAEMGAVKLGRMWRITRADLNAWIERQRPKPTAVTPEHADPTPIRPDIDVSGLPDISPVTGERFSWDPRL